MIDYNKKYKFISDGTWFLEGSECLVVDGFRLWTDEDINGKEELSYEYLIANKDRIDGIFSGPTAKNPDDEELCSLTEFAIIERVNN